jgi:hypothetical protein
MIRERGLDSWLPTYLRQIPKRHNLRRLRRRQLTHILFLVCDHYEPRHGVRRPEDAAARVRAWHSGYRQLQEDNQARYGLRPLHTWFYPPHHGLEFLPAIAAMAYDGLGEVELHYHHQGDTEESLRINMRKALADFRSAGLLLQAGDPPVTRFGFIHGDWALDNSAHGKFCGVNSELSLLEELGCWGDLTMPSSNECQTRKINSIYYAVDDPKAPKSHDWGEDARVGASDAPGLLMIQGPIGLNFGAPRYPRIENASLTSLNWGRADRIRTWLDCHVHVRARPEWLFIKLHTHGAIEEDFDALFGDKARTMHRTLAEQFNDGKRYRLHYVTARQAYNLVRAAEAGMGGDPSPYLDYALGKQATAYYCLDARHRLECCTAERLEIRSIDPGTQSLLKLGYLGLKSVRGPLRSCIVDVQRSLLEIELHGDRGELTLEGNVGSLKTTVGAAVRSRADGAITLACDGPITLNF